jgi:hypothetical protein
MVISHCSVLLAPNQELIFLKTGKVIQNRKALIHSSILVSEEDFRWIFRRSLVVDGNFSAEHLKMRKAEKDVKLVHGEGYMVDEIDYKHHLLTGVHDQEVGP